LAFRGEAIAAAIRQRIDEGVMADYLKTRGSEVENMIFTEFDIDVAKEVWMEEARQDGREAGIEIGEARGEARKALEMVRTMISYGVPIEKAALIAGIPIDELRLQLDAPGSPQLPPH
jgi:predicted transposase YdaD